MEFVVYILHSLSDNSNYVGMTSHLCERIKSHNIYGKDWTRKHRPWMVVHVEFFKEKSDAMKIEKSYKSGRGLYRKKEIIDEFLTKFYIG